MSFSTPRSVGPEKCGICAVATQTPYNTTRKGDKTMEANHKISDALTLQGILTFLPGGVSTDKIFLYPVLESTNLTAKEMAAAGAAHGTVVIAEHQTAGRGRHGRSFHSPAAHGIYMSIILATAQVGLSTHTLVTAFAGLAVCEAIEKVCAKSPQIKWVNDIFLCGKKICGILTESAAESVVVGIGINFSTPKTGFPGELSQTAGAIFSGGSPSVSRNRLTGEVVGRILTPRPYSEATLLEEYKRRLFMLGKSILVTGAGQPYEATALDIDSTGRLVVRKTTSEVVALSTGEVSIRPGETPS